MDRKETGSELHSACGWSQVGRRCQYMAALRTRRPSYRLKFHVSSVFWIDVEASRQRVTGRIVTALDMCKALVVAGTLTDESSARSAARTGCHVMAPTSVNKPVSAALASHQLEWIIMMSNREWWTQQMTRAIALLVSGIVSKDVIVTDDPEHFALFNLRQFLRCYCEMQ